MHVNVYCLRNATRMESVTLFKLIECAKMKVAGDESKFIVRW